MNKISQHARKGFTLVEIMIVVVIIGLLAAMAVPAFNKVRQTATEKTILNDLRQLSAAAAQYFLENGGVAEVPVATLTTEYVQTLNTRPPGATLPPPPPRTSPQDPGRTRGAPPGTCPEPAAGAW